MKEMEEIIYKIGGTKRPSYNWIERNFLKLKSIPFISKFKIIKRYIYEIYGIPLSTSFDKKFYCSAKNLYLGENVGLGDTFILAYAPVSIGDNCSFSFRNTIITSTHDLKNFSTVIAKPVKIGKNVWITTNVTILPGVTIGDNTIIGAGSIVASDIPSNVLAAGNPCKVIKNIEFVK